jgi:hypothetical protein
LTAALALAATGCATADDHVSPDSFAVTDSAGVEIVTSAGGGWAEGEGWTLGDAATVLGGSEDMFAGAGGEEPQELWMIRGFAPLPDRSTGVQPFWIAPDRTVFGSALSRERQQAPVPSGVYRPGTGYALLTAQEREPVLLGWYDGLEQERMEVGGGTRSVVAPFARSRSFAVTSWSEPRVLVADNQRYEIRIFDTEGALQRIVRREYAPVAVEDRWIEAWKDAQRGRRWTQGQLPVLKQTWARMTVRETLPPLEGMTLDSLGYLWVVRPAGMPHDSLTFDVFDPDGRYLGDLAVPGGLRPIPAPVIGADYLMGVWADELDVETVRVYSLDRGR